MARFYAVEEGSLPASLRKRRLQERPSGRYDAEMSNVPLHRRSVRRWLVPLLLLMVLVIGAAATFLGQPGDRRFSREAFDDLPQWIDGDADRTKVERVFGPPGREAKSDGSELADYFESARTSSAPRSRLTQDAKQSASVCGRATSGKTGDTLTTWNYWLRSIQLGNSRDGALRTGMTRPTSWTKQRFG